MKNVKLSLQLTAEDAEALGQFIKRAGIEDYRRRAGDEREANAIYNAFLELGDALRKVGIDPR